jgi:UDP-2,3-diacylglucosamine hydrolase
MDRVYFVSDIHMRPHFMRRASFFTAFLHSIQGAGALFMLGDIFDFWVGVGQLRMALADPVFRAMRLLRQSGTELFFIGGNRDFLVGSELTRACGVQVLGESAMLDLGGRKVHVSHGDQFCTKDADYMIFRAFIRNPLLTAAFKHLTPLFVRMMVAKMMRRSSKAVVKKKARKIRDINLKVIRRRFARGTDIVICGHIHQPRLVTMSVKGKERRVYVLGHWDEGPSYLLYQNGEFTFEPGHRE